MIFCMFLSMFKFFVLIIYSIVSYSKHTTGSGQCVGFDFIAYISVYEKYRDNYGAETSDPASFSLP